MRFTILFILCVFCSFQSSAQNSGIDSLKNVIKNSPDDSNKVNNYRLLFIATINKLNAAQSIPIARQQLALAEKIHYKSGIAKAYKLLGVGYWSVGDLQKAVSYYLQSLKVYEELKDEWGMAGCYTNMGLVYKEQGDFDESLRYFNKALKVWEAAKNTMNTAHEMAHIGELYEAEGANLKALEAYNKAIEISSSVSNKALKATLLYNKASINYKLKQYNESQTDLLKALQLGLESTETYPIPEIYNLLSKIAGTKKHYDEELKFAENALAIAKRADYNVILPESYAQIADAYKQLKNYRQAFNYQTYYIKAKDSILNAGNIRKIELLQYNYKLEKKEIINQTLLKDKKLKEATILLQNITIQRQYVIGSFITFSLLFLIILSLLFYRNLQAKKWENELLNKHELEIMAQNREIELQKENLSQINHTKDRLFSIISHDLRSPLAALCFLLQMANEEIVTAEEVKAMLPSFSVNVSNMLSMLDNMLNWALSQMTGLNLQPKTFDISELIRNNVNAFKAQAAQKNISLIDESPQQVWVYADVSTIEIILRNLIINAIKFCNSGDYIRIGILIKDDFCNVSVTDTGIGISDEVQQRLFSTTTVYSTSGTANEKGTGLGLTLCRDLAEVNGGKIWIDKEYKEGSRFVFSIVIKEII